MALAPSQNTRTQDRKLADTVALYLRALGIYAEVITIASTGGPRFSVRVTVQRGQKRKTALVDLLTAFTSKGQELGSGVQAELS